MSRTCDDVSDSVRMPVPAMFIEGAQVDVYRIMVRQQQPEGTLSDTLINSGTAMVFAFTNTCMQLFNPQYQTGEGIE